MYLDLRSRNVAEADTAAAVVVEASTVVVEAADFTAAVAAVGCAEVAVVVERIAAAGRPEVSAAEPLAVRGAAERTEIIAAAATSAGADLTAQGAARMAVPAAQMERMAQDVGRRRTLVIQEARRVDLAH